MTNPEWIDRDGRRVWSESWEAKRGAPFTPGEMAALRAQAKQHLDDAARDGKIPAMAWVLVERLFATTDRIRENTFARLRASVEGMP